MELNLKLSHVTASSGQFHSCFQPWVEEQLNEGLQYEACPYLHHTRLSVFMAASYVKFWEQTLGRYHRFKREPACQHNFRHHFQL
jgi:hypothetical protein